MKGPIPKTPSPLALAIRANVERAARGESRPTDEPYILMTAKLGDKFRVQSRAHGIRFPTLDGIPTADWLECREIERQLG